MEPSWSLGTTPRSHAPFFQQHTHSSLFIRSESVQYRLSHVNTDAFQHCITWPHLNLNVSGPDSDLLRSMGL